MGTKIRLERYAIVDDPADRDFTWTTESYAEAQHVALRRGGVVLALTFEVSATEVVADFTPRGAAVLG